MKLRSALALAAVTALVLVPTSPVAADPGPSGAGPDGSGQPPAGTVIDESFDASEIDAAIAPADEGQLTAREQSAVDSYLDTQDPGNVLYESDLEVGTLQSDAITVTVVAPVDGVDIDGVEVDASSSSSVTMASSMTSDSTAASATGPTMGTWPDWTTSWHASVELRLYYYDDYLGNATFQTYKQQLQNDNSTSLNYFRVARYAIAQPAKWDSFGPNGPMRVWKLWGSQALDASDRAHAQEWMLQDTHPDEDSQVCSNPSNGIGPWLTYTYTDCSDYHVWRGTKGNDDIGHMRVNMDQGDYVGSGSRSLAYTSAYSMDAIAGQPNYTWYEFVTFIKPDIGPDGVPGVPFKCPSRVQAPRDTTSVEPCVWEQDKIVADPGDPGDPGAPGGATPEPIWREWFLTNSLSGGSGEYGPTFYGVDSGDIPVVGDWNMDARDTPGVFRVEDGYGWWYLTDQHGGIPAMTHHAVQFGLANDFPVPGDWDANNTATPGVYRVVNGLGYWYLSNTLNGDVAAVVQFGVAGDFPVSGDWDGNGTWTPGIFRGGTWYLSNDFSGTVHAIYGYGSPGNIPVAGDWNGDGLWTPGVVQGSYFYLNNNWDGTHDVLQAFGNGWAGGDFPVAGDWNGNGLSTVGVSRAG